MQDPMAGDAARGGAPAVQELRAGGFVVEVTAGLVPRGPEDLLRLTDPANAAATVHWGRNYLYRARYAAQDGEIEVVVKQFRPPRGARRRLEALRGGPGKARKSWRMARTFLANGIATAEPVALLEPAAGDGAAFFVTRHLAGVVEARHLLRAANAGTVERDFPAVDYPRFLADLGRLARRMHDAGLFHRDLSIGNVLVATEGDDRGRLYLVDLNRARELPRLGVVRRARDLCRLAIFRRGDRETFLGAYRGGRPGLVFRLLYLLFHYGFRAKRGAKDRWRALWRRVGSWLVPRGVHAHIPRPAAGTAARDKAVWDHLSDQPHHHAGRFEKLAIRLADAPSHLREALVLGAAMPRIVRRYRALRRELFARPAPMDGIGVALRPLPEAPTGLTAAVADLGVRHVLLRLHPWEGTYDAEETLARTLRDAGCELAFAVPQNRDLVRDPLRWRRELETIAERFAPLGRSFQVGQAPNRSKWGAWTHGEYLELAAIAAEVLRAADPAVEVLGPAVIDFEPQVTAAIVNAPAAARVRFDALASLLYVDRRGAPENTQLGFDTPRKLALLAAIADTARHGVAHPGGARSWVTEVNWPLWEGPHSPAGRAVSVDEAHQAAYLARYYLLALASGMVERVYWWQLVARGYGLANLADGVLHRRPAFAALATLQREVGGGRFLRRLASDEGTWLLLFADREGRETVAGWSTRGEPEVALPRPADRVVELDGTVTAGGPRVRLGPAVRYGRLGD